ncbi:DNA-binding response regulator [Paraferrimonas haliotis]|uniref:DNA-binding response regulator n=1 Tax=Paraferrimonas haliotis TaxID=2013866 RepID=A0AA37TYC3_9GAMM|nr:DNA-binding response regulator [Paraferrimonas haliotis]
MVDDHDIVRVGVRRILEDEPSIDVIGECSSGEQAIAWATANDADVVLMDLNMPGIGGIEATAKIVERNPEQRVIVLTALHGPEVKQLTDRVGAYGLLSKNLPAEQMIQAIHKVACGQRLGGEEKSEQPVFNLEKRRRFSTLSKRELQIVLLMTTGLDSLAIAECLQVSRKTINSFRYRIHSKLEASSDEEVVALAIKQGLVEGTPPVTH